MQNHTVQQIAQIAQILQRIIAQSNPTSAPTFGVLLEEFLLAKERAGRCRDYLRRVPVTLRTFTAGR